MLTLNNLIISPASLGNKMLLTGVNPVYAYDENRNRTKNISGYRYDIVLAEKAYEKIGVKIQGEKQMEHSVNAEAEQVELVEPEIKAYAFNGDIKIMVSAKGIHKVGR